MASQSLTTEEKKNILASQQNVTIIGARLIGVSWAPLFLANGLKVLINDPRQDIEEVTLKSMAEISPTLSSLGYNKDNLTKNLSFEKDINIAVQNADVVQENGPENVDFKQDFYAGVEPNLKPSALILSSSSGITHSIFTAKMKNAGRVYGAALHPPLILFHWLKWCRGEIPVRMQSTMPCSFIKPSGKAPYSSRRKFQALFPIGFKRPF